MTDSKRGRPTIFENKGGARARRTAFLTERGAEYFERVRKDLARVTGKEKVPDSQVVEWAVREVVRLKKLRK